MGLILNGEMHDTRLDAVSRSEEWVGAIWKLLRWRSCALKTAGLSLGGDRAGQSTQGGLGPRRWGGAIGLLHGPHCRNRGETAG